MGRNALKNEQMRMLTKEEIEKQALLYFAKYGYYGTKMSDLSKGIGISSGLIYHYYPSKEELLKQILKNILESRDQDLLPLKNADISVKDKIHYLTSGMKHLILTSDVFPSRFTLMESINLFPASKHDFELWAYPAIEILADIIKEGQKQQKIYDGNPISMSISYWGLVSAMCRDQIYSKEDLNYDFDALNRMLLKEE